MIYICLLFIVVSFLINLPLTMIIRNASTRAGLLDQVGEEAHKRHENPVPNTGGIGIFWAIAIPMLLIMFLVLVIPESIFQKFLPDVVPHLPGLRDRIPMGGGILGSLAVLHFMGLFDDRRALGPFIKLIVQIGVSAALVIFAQMRILEFLDTAIPTGYALSVLVSILWFVIIINAFNMLDNMDGLSGGVAAVIAALFLASTIIGGQWFVASLAAMLLGALIAFLCFNFPPAKIFMGDGGSLVIGALIAVLSVRTTYFDSNAAGITPPGHWYGVLMPLMVLAIPLYDFISVTLIRLAQGRSPFAGDHQHFSHRLVRKGLSRRAAVFVIWLCTLCTGLSGVMLGTLDKWQAVLAALNTLAVVILLAILEHTAPQKEKESV
ncbi:MraY family glycosyltransferase [Poriferisphaera sp. WC338]|uniref:MraY family glycosyltransferase n=1 Tax=Poriferisphaera sp. WC338 TaxID=3425129 RepID=UPI003D816F61